MTTEVNLERFLDDIKTVVRHGEQLLKTSAGTLKNRAVTGAQTTDRVVRENAYKTIGIAFGVGLAVGLIAAGMYAARDSDEG